MEIELPTRLRSANVSPTNNGFVVSSHDDGVSAGRRSYLKYKLDTIVDSILALIAATTAKHSMFERFRLTLHEHVLAHESIATLFKLAFPIAGCLYRNCGCGNDKNGTAGQLERHETCEKTVAPNHTLNAELNGGAQRHPG